ncbi:MAG: WecB/TagA/CpsF family glycosyltransferase [Ezakiella sp.]|uniref:WecB/TagA/CpsF family glycosyltransferase n=1 Tax=Ezakiella sp. TaxID=1935205 RepID=UPI002977D7AB|nr:WecB/TagA/CpsF family glycosyltransferase [Ezakiella sp.]MDD7731830.1 WecB/TagA/CpsF family glycosyltransferase [Eubacteriales bacterium]MDY6079623.1 WecB/TagA/CpsF family glycosyltransferase [Ezakiella sp.]
MNKVNVLDIRFSNISDEELLNVLKNAFKSDSNLRIVTPNPEIVMAANKSDDLKEMINNSTLVLKDGIGIKIAEKLKGIKGEKRQTGIETLERLLEIADENGYSVYFVGAKDEILQKAIVNIKSKFPNIVVKGQHNGYFKDGSPEEEQILKDIEEKKPDLLIAAMGFPKQEIFLTKTKAPKVSIACGGSLDVMSGEVKRAPRWMQKVGLEWFYRLIKDPGRIKRQIVIPVFLWKIVFTKNSCFMEENND